MVHRSSDFYDDLRKASFQRQGSTGGYGKKLLWNSQYFQVIFMQFRKKMGR